MHSLHYSAILSEKKNVKSPFFFNLKTALANANSARVYYKLNIAFTFYGYLGEIWRRERK